MVWVEKRPVPPPPHFCAYSIPNDRVGDGSVWQCDGCGKKWAYDSYYKRWDSLREPKEPFVWWWNR